METEIWTLIAFGILCLVTGFFWGAVYVLLNQKGK
jgi:hypothetical protein